MPTAPGQLCAILLGAAVGWRLVAPTLPPAGAQPALAVPRAFSLCCLAALPLLLFGLPALAALVPSHPLALASRFYRAGALVFGGGHVVLPLLRDVVVPPGWIGDDRFLAGYGAVQAMPGPLFTFAAYLGAAMRPGPSGWLGGALCLGAISLPSFLLLLGVLPFWEGLRCRPPVRAALAGVNAAVVGVLLAALYTPVWTTAIATPADFALALAAFLLLVTWRVPPWLVVALGAAVAAVL